MKDLPMRVLRRLFWYVCKIFPVDEKKIIFCSYFGRKYSDNPKYVAEELNKRRPDLHYIWIAEEPENAETPKNFKTVKPLSLSYIYHMSTAKVWVDNSRKSLCYKKKNQYYMQTWHGSFGLKKIEKDAEGLLGDDYEKMAKRDGSQCDVLLSNSKTLTKLYRDAFWLRDDCEIIEKGLPRNDRLCNFTDETVKSIRREIGLDDDVKVLLYAPTFRDAHTLDVYNMDYERMCNALSKRFGGKWVCLLRLHPNVFKLSSNIKTDNVTTFDVSAYPDIQNLYIISDITVTDYSSVMFDFMILHRPCLLYASDVEDYRKERDFFMSIDELPFPLAQNNDEMEKNILDFNEENYFEKADAFYEKHGLCDNGEASAAAADWIISKISE